jgi:hypothetical protein
MKRALVLIGFLLASCGDPKLGGPCKSHCDCTATLAPIKCAGEWACNAQSTCEYSCKNPCGGGGVSTCPADETCNGQLCSLKTGCR